MRNMANSPPQHKGDASSSCPPEEKDRYFPEPCRANRRDVLPSKWITGEAVAQWRSAAPGNGKLPGCRRVVGHQPGAPGMQSAENMPTTQSFPPKSRMHDMRLLRALGEK